MYRREGTPATGRCTGSGVQRAGGSIPVIRRYKSCTVAIVATKMLSVSEAGRIDSGSVAGNLLTLKLKGESRATKVTYLDSRSWSEKNLLMGGNGIAALTFWNVPILAGKPAR